MTAGVLQICVLVCATYVALVYAAYVALAVIGVTEGRRRARDEVTSDHAAIGRSRFAPGVSVLVPAYNEAAGLPAAVRSLLEVDYPQFEVIVVNDGSTDETVERMREAFELVPADADSRGVADTEAIVAVYRSAVDRRLLFIDKVGGGKADALNVGLNHSSHPFVCGVDADMVFAPDALSTAMRAFLTDPTTVGLTSYIEIAADPTAAQRDGTQAGESRLLILFQVLDYLRAFYNNRVAWSRLDFMLCAVGAFQVWRRDLLDDLRGWSRDFTCEDIELTFRVHKVMRERGVPYRVLCLPDCVGRTEGPDTVRKLVAQRERWQRVILETWWAYRSMCFDRRYGTVGLLGMPYYLASEIVAPAFEIIAVSTAFVGAVLGLMDWWLFFSVLGLLALSNSLLSTVSLLIVDPASRAYRTSGIVRLLPLMPLELFFYRPVLSWARIKGTWRYLRGDKAWHKFDRNARVEAA